MRFVVTLLLVLTRLSSLQAAPTGSNVSFTQRTGTKLVDVSYELAVSVRNPTVRLEMVD